ncbi:MAG: ferrichrome-iron receptor, partial [Verrucomicrobia bacterium]|nr:ferrichrome-iron receptor [Verrucomicrobiota bacterium]
MLRLQLGSSVLVVPRMVAASRCWFTLTSERRRLVVPSSADLPRYPMITRLPSPHGRKCRGLALAFILSPCCFAALLGAEPEKPAFVLAGDTTGPGAGATASGGPEEKDGSGVSADADDSIVSMGAFKVGLGHYIEASSAASMKVEVPLMNLPFTVQGLNAAFLKDVNSSRLEDSFGYVVGLTKSGSTANSFSLRGFSAAGSNLQSVQIDGLPGLSSRFASPPTVAVERMEVLKGPTSVLYGQGNPGGLLNIVTKSPQGKSQTVLSGYVSSYAGRTSGLGDAVGWTASFDTTGPIAASKHWFFRVIGSYE